MSARIMSPERASGLEVEVWAAPREVAVGYIRVSREEQAREGVSLEVQRARIVAYAEAKDLRLEAVYADEGVSGKELERSGLRELLARCTAGDVSHVIVWKLDRLTRRTRHLLGLVEDLFLSRDVELHSVSESLDTATPHGRFVLTLFGGLAQMERELIAERTRSALAWKGENGLPTSHPPLGFRSIGKRERLEPVREELEVVGEILGLWQAGWTFRAIARALNSSSTPTKRRRRWHHSTIGKVVSHRCRYAWALGNPGFPPDTSERACPPRSSGGVPVWQDGRLTRYPHRTPQAELSGTSGASRYGTACCERPLPSPCSTNLTPLYSPTNPKSAGPGDAPA
jgi:DNA invertase Pin-like site-specific DNA recombinase